MNSPTDDTFSDLKISLTDDHNVRRTRMVVGDALRRITIENVPSMILALLRSLGEEGKAPFQTSAGKFFRHRQSAVQLNYRDGRSQRDLKVTPENALQSAVAAFRSKLKKRAVTRSEKEVLARALNALVNKGGEVCWKGDLTITGDPPLPEVPGKDANHDYIGKVPLAQSKTLEGGASTGAPQREEESEDTSDVPSDSSETISAREISCARHERGWELSATARFPGVLLVGVRRMLRNHDVMVCFHRDASSSWMALPDGIWLEEGSPAYEALRDSTVPSHKVGGSKFEFSGLT